MPTGLTPQLHAPRTHSFLGIIFLSSGGFLKVYINRQRQEILALK